MGLVEEIFLVAFNIFRKGLPKPSIPSPSEKKDFRFIFFACFKTYTSHYIETNLLVCFVKRFSIFTKVKSPAEHIFVALADFVKKIELRFSSNQNISRESV